MARRPQSSASTHDGGGSRRSSMSRSNPNVFSDDYAVDLADSLGLPSPTHSISSRPEELDYNPQSGPREFVPPGLPGPSFSLNRSSLTKRPLPDDASSSHDPHRALSVSNHSEADTRRTLSVSSRMSIPRSQSPYRGPTAPSQPYGQYNQVTRASSIISDATIRPLELPFVSHRGPEHPYTMFTQSTIPDDASSERHVDMGFAGISRPYRSGQSTTGNEVGDIVGRDGHIEQLPPYSRYADNVIAKGDMQQVEPQTSNISADSTPDTIVPTAEASGSDVELTAVGGSDRSTDELARKEGMPTEKKRRTCFGLPIWTVVVVIAVIVLAAVLGGVIGGVVGNQHGTKHAAA
jgi:hypothetical protein